MLDVRCVGYRSRPCSGTCVRAERSRWSPGGSRPGGHPAQRPPAVGVFRCSCVVRRGRTAERGVDPAAARGRPGTGRSRRRHHRAHDAGGGRRRRVRGRDRDRVPGVRRNPAVPGPDGSHGVLLLARFDTQTGVAWRTGYIVETSSSVATIVVVVLIMGAFAVARHLQQRALLGASSGRSSSPPRSTCCARSSRARRSTSPRSATTTWARRSPCGPTAGVSSRLSRPWSSGCSAPTWCSPWTPCRLGRRAVLSSSGPHD